MNLSRVNKGVSDIRARYEKRGRFEARVTLKGMDYDADTNASKPSLNIDAGPLVVVNAVGAKVSQGKMRSLVPVFEEHSVDESLLLEGARNLRNYFQSEGYFDAEVEFKPQRVVNDKATIDYLINPGKRHKLVADRYPGQQIFPHRSHPRAHVPDAALPCCSSGAGATAGICCAATKNPSPALYQSNGFRDVSVTHKLVDGYQRQAGPTGGFHPRSKKVPSTSSITWTSRASSS